MLRLIPYFFILCGFILIFFSQYKVFNNLNQFMKREKDIQLIRNSDDYIKKRKRALFYSKWGFVILVVGAILSIWISVLD